MTAGRLLVEGELSLTVDGQPVHVTADGARVVVTTSRPTVVLRQAAAAVSALRTDRRPSLRATATAVAAFRRTGVVVELRGPRGTIASIGGPSSGRARRAGVAAAAVGLVTLAGVVARRILSRR